MSQISSKVAEALYEALNVVTVTDLATGGVWYETRQGDLPAVIFHRQAAGKPVRSFGPTLLAEDDFWLIKSYADEDSDPSKSPQALNDEILIAAEQAIGDSLSLASGSTWLVWRENDVLLPKEEGETDKPVYGAGFLLRVVAAP